MSTASFYGQRDDPYAVISGLGERLEERLSQETALPTIVETIAGALRLPYVAIALTRDHDPRIAAQQGEPGVRRSSFRLTSGSRADRRADRLPAATVKRSARPSGGCWPISPARRGRWWRRCG